MEKHFSLSELAHTLSLSTRTLQRYIKQGIIPAKRTGKKLLISEQDIQKYLNPNGALNTASGGIHTFCARRKSEMVTLLQSLVAISSESETKGEEELAYFINSHLGSLGIRSVIRGVGESVTVHASLGYKNDGILLDCPLDTTPAGDRTRWTYPPFEGIIRDGKMYGRGTADAKAGMVAMIYALLALRETVGEEQVRVELVFDGGEQNGAYYGMKQMLSEGLHVTSGIIGYAGTMDEVAVGARGYHRFEVISHGKASHTGSRNHYGINAITTMAKFMLEVDKIIFPSSKNALFPFGSKITFSQIKGGTAINIVPDLCTAGLDVRVTPEIKRQDVEKALETVRQKLVNGDPSINIEFRYTVGEEGYAITDKMELVSSLASSAEEVLGQKPDLIANGPAHIGNLLHKYGIPVAVYGPKGGNVHAYDEYVEIDSLPKTAEIYARTILRHFGLSE